MVIWKAVPPLEWKLADRHSPVGCYMGVLGIARLLACRIE